MANKMQQPAVIAALMHRATERLTKPFQI